MGYGRQATGGAAQGNRIWNPNPRYSCFCGGVGPQNSVFADIFCHSVPFRLAAPRSRRIARGAGLGLTRHPEIMLGMRYRTRQGPSVTGFPTEVSLTQSPGWEKKAIARFASLHVGRALGPGLAAVDGGHRHSSLGGNLLDGGSGEWSDVLAEAQQCRR